MYDAQFDSRNIATVEFDLFVRAKELDAALLELLKGDNFDARWRSGKRRESDVGRLIGSFGLLNLWSSRHDGTLADGKLRYVEKEPHYMNVG
jgi:hypothetical protein